MRRVALLGARSYWAGRQNHDPTGNKNERLFDQNRQLVQPKGCVLTRAYARATAGTPKTQNMDTVTSVFDYSYAPDSGLDANGHHTPRSSCRLDVMVVATPPPSPVVVTPFPRARATSPTS